MSCCAWPTPALGRQARAQRPHHRRQGASDARHHHRRRPRQPAHAHDRERPQCFAEIQGKRILDWTIEALKRRRLHEDLLRRRLSHGSGAARLSAPGVYRANTDWPNNNILVSLMCAEDLMDRPFVTAYSDILFTPQLVAGLVQARDEIVLGVDTDWREHYGPRKHPPHDAEKVITRGGRVERVHRGIPYEDATGEFVGVARSARTARCLRGSITGARPSSGANPIARCRCSRRRTWIHLFQDMIEQGIAFGHADTPGKYREIDTQETWISPRPCGDPDMPSGASNLRPLPLFPASIVGSIPRPLVVRELIESRIGTPPTPRPWMPPCASS